MGKFTKKELEAEATRLLKQNFRIRKGKLFLKAKRKKKK